MLDFMRRNANSWVMIFLFAIIIFVFAINFGPWAGNVSGGKPYAAIVNNQTISLAEFRAAYANQFARIKQFRPDYSEEQANKDGLKKLILEQLISRELLTQLGRKNHLSIGAKTLAEEIKERVFGEQDFNKEDYQRRVLSFFGTSVSDFEKLVEKETIAQFMADFLGTALYVSDSEVKQSFIDKNTKAVVEFVKINPQYYTSQRAISPQEIGKFITEHEEQISNYYNEHLSQFVKEEQVKASHILIKIASNASDEEKSKKKAQAQDLLDRIKKGENFATLAQKESDDLGTKASGGDLGFFTAGMMVEEFSKAAFALKPNEVSDVVESPFGYHIIKVSDKMDASTQTLENARNEIAEILIKEQEQKSKAHQAASQALAQLQKGVPLKNVHIPGLINKINSAAAVSGNSPIADETASFNRSARYIQKLGKADDISGTIFKLDMKNPSAQEVIESNGLLYAIRLKSLEEADMSKFDEEKDAIRSNLAYPRRRELVQQYLTHLKDQAKISYNQELFAQSDSM
ncbi:MAG: peptidylprolyl isomerase [Myxococcales bacterium]|nr:peptidylprolyl isomerase [Myxococcales bacterium]USN50514.1 MAG: peptidylprolyl isomerase [Myxococcales bacterium]